MRAKNTQSLLGQALFGATLALGSTLALSAHAAAPGITGTSGAPVFNLNAAAMRVNQPNGKSLYSWGYGCSSTTGNSFAPATVRGANCPTAQLPGPTLSHVLHCTSSSKHAVSERARDAHHCVHTNIRRCHRCSPSDNCGTTMRVYTSRPCIEIQMRLNWNDSIACDDHGIRHWTSVRAD